MLAFLVQRISQAILVMFVISVISFTIQDGLGDPLQQLVGMSVSEEERDALREEMGLNDPMITQYFRFAGNALQGDLGVSYFYGEPTMDVILRHLPATLELVIAASLMIIFLSVPIGVYAAIRPAACVDMARDLAMEFAKVGMLRGYTAESFEMEAERWRSTAAPIEQARLAASHEAGAIEVRVEIGLAVPERE